MPRQPKPYQFDLFANPDGAQVLQTPLWQALPAETRQVLMQLMVHLILDHAGRGHAPERGEARHDV